MNINYSVLIALASMVAAIASAYAALMALRISRESVVISKSSALAVNHASASLTYTKVLKELNLVTQDLSEVCSDLLIKWPREIDAKDHPSCGGVNPRPLKHVLSNGYEMVVDYSLNCTLMNRSTQRVCIDIVRNSFFDEHDFKLLLTQADHAYSDFEGVFGAPDKSCSIIKSQAFRWVYYQLFKRISVDDWCHIWEISNSGSGWLVKYKKEHLKIRSVLEEARENLIGEISKLEHTAFPLTVNIDLFNKYEAVLFAINNILNDSCVEFLDSYDHPSLKGKYSLLILCALSSVNLSLNQINRLNGRECFN